MSDYADLSAREVRDLRERCIDRMEHAAYAAWLAAAWSGGLLLLVAADTGAWPEVTPYLASSAATAALGYGVYQRRQWPAIVLLLNWAGGLAVRWVEAGIPPNILTTALFGFFIIRGVIASVEYAELRKDHPDAVQAPGR